MKIIKRIFLLIVVLTIVYFVLALIGPAKYRVERSIKINSPVENVFNQTSIYSNWVAWSPWAAADPEAKYTIENDNQEVGALLAWKGKVSGTGSMTSIEVLKNEKFIYQMVFTEPWYMAMTSTGGFHYEQQDNVVNLSWFDEGDIGFMSRPMMLFMDLENMVGPQFEKGLSNIKEICEKMEKKPTIEVAEETVEGSAMLFISESSSLIPGEISAKMGAAYGELMSLIGIAKLEIASAPIAITRKFSLEEMMCEFDAALILDELPENFEVSGRIEKGKTYTGKVLKTVHVGSYLKLKSTYDQMIAYIASKGYERNGDSWEEYIDDPREVSEDIRRTNIYFPIK